MNKHGWLGKDRTVRFRRPLGISTSTLDWQVIKQYRHLIMSHNTSLGHLFPGLVQQPRIIREVMGSFLLPFLHLNNVGQHVSPWAALAPSIPSSHDSVPNRQGSWEQRSLVGWFLNSGRKFPHKSVHHVLFLLDLMDQNWGRASDHFIHWWEEPSTLFGLHQYS